MVRFCPVTFFSNSSDGAAQLRDYLHVALSIHSFLFYRIPPLPPMSTRRKFTGALFPCPLCRKVCKSPGGLKQHQDAVHYRPQPQAIAGGARAHDDGDDGPAPDHGPFNNGSPPPSPGPDNNETPPSPPGPEPPQSPPLRPTVPQSREGTTTDYHPILDGTCNVIFRMDKSLTVSYRIRHTLRRGRS